MMSTATARLRSLLLGLILAAGLALPAAAQTGTAASKASIMTSLADNTTGSITAQVMRNVVETLYPTEVAVTFATSIALNLDTQPNTRITMTGNPTITFSGLFDGGTGIVKLYQDATGNRVPTLAGCTLANTPVYRTTNSPNIPNFVTVMMSNAVRFCFVS